MEIIEVSGYVAEEKLAIAKVIRFSFFSRYSIDKFRLELSHSILCQTNSR